MAVKVLYVEDARTFQRLMQKMFEGLFDLSIASTRDEGWDLLCREAYSLVICDFMFAEGDAFPLIFKIRKQFSPTELPIIMLTSAADRMNVGKFYGCGVNTTVRKLPEAEKFRDLVFRMIRKPWVDKPEVTAGDAYLLSWTMADRGFAFCPNLRIQTEAATVGEALQQMHDELRKVLATGSPIPTIGSAKPSTFVPVPAEVAAVAQAAAAAEVAAVTEPAGG
jgi:CheY-like chemotaxis protein